MNLRLVAAGLCFSGTVCHAQTEDRALAGAQRWVGRSLIVRGFYGADELRYHAAGKVEGTPKVVDWTLAGVDLTEVKRVDAETLELDGLRVVVRYNPDTQLFDRIQPKDRRVKFLVGIPKTGTSAVALLGVEPVDETLGEVFSIGIDPGVQRSVPDFWRHYFDPRMPWQGDGLDGKKIYPEADAKGKQLTDGLVYPAVSHRTDVPETAEAEKAKVRGGVLLRIVVDEHGAVKRVSVAKPMGFGLDALAVESIKGWAFTPGTVGGVVVPVRMDVNVVFAPMPVKR